MAHDKCVDRWAGVIAIILGKVAALLCGVGGIVILKYRSAPSDVCENSKEWAVAGAGSVLAEAELEDADGNLLAISGSTASFIALKK